MAYIDVDEEGCGQELHARCNRCSSEIKVPTYECAKCGGCGQWLFADRYLFRIWDEEELKRHCALPDIEGNMPKQLYISSGYDVDMSHSVLRGAEWTQKYHEIVRKERVTCLESMSKAIWELLPIFGYNAHIIQIGDWLATKIVIAQPDIPLADIIREHRELRLKPEAPVASDSKDITSAEAPC